MNQTFLNEICSIVGSDHLKLDEPMKKHTTFRVGGGADYMICPHSGKEIQEVVAICHSHQIPYFILGNGSNLLVGDGGYRGAVIHLNKNMSVIRGEGNRIIAQAGALLSKVAARALEQSLTGFEFAAGIPGTLGGAVTMNAGAYGGVMGDVLESVTVLDQQGNIRIVSVKELELGYRTSRIQKEGWVVIEATIILEPGVPSSIKEKMDSLKEQRTQKQPLEFPSAGSTFKRPEGSFAGKLIMDAGLGGYQIGGAAVSTKHCGFLINTGDATAKDVMDLIHYVQHTVKEKFNVNLETEVKLLGEFS